MGFRPIERGLGFSQLVKGFVASSHFGHELFCVFKQVLISMCFGLGINVRRTDSSSVDIGDDKFNTQSLISESFVDEFLSSFLLLDNLAFNILLCLANLYIDLDNLSGLLGFIPKSKHMDIRDRFKDTKQFVSKI